MKNKMLKSVFSISLSVIVACSSIQVSAYANELVTGSEVIEEGGTYADESAVYYEADEDAAVCDLTYEEPEESASVEPTLEVTDEGVIKKATGGSGEYIIPAKYEGKTIIGIGNEAFRTTTLSKITIPNTVTSIGSKAFYNLTTLSEVRFEGDFDSLTIGNQAFQSCTALASVTLPIGLTSIGTRCFQQTAIKEITIPETVTAIGSEAFRQCGMLTKVNYNTTASVPDRCFNYDAALQSITIPEGIISIGAYAFHDCKALSEVNLPNTLASIGNYAFQSCDTLTEITIPASVSSIGTNAFTSGIGNTKYTKLIYGQTGSDAETYANNNNIAFYDKANPKTFTITYTNVEGAVNENPASYRAITDTITLKDPVKAGYRFNRWTYEGKSSSVTTIPKYSMGNRTLIANWSLITYYISCNTNGGTMSENNPSSYNVETSTINLLNPTRDGYTFLGWYTEATFENKIESIPKGSTGDLNLFARWQIIDYPITYVLKGGENSINNPATINKESGYINLTDPIRKGYDFVGWYLEPTYVTQITSLSGYDAKEMTIYAKWKAHKYTIRYNANGGQGKMSNTITATYDKEYKLDKNKFTRKGYTFKGWNTKKDGKGFSLKNKQTVKNLTDKEGKKVTLYAQWKGVPYTIIFNANGGKGKMKNISATYGKKYVLKKSTFAKIGYTFAGWNTKADGTGISIKDRATVKNLTTKSKGKVTLYAQWK